MGKPKPPAPKRRSPGLGQRTYKGTVDRLLDRTHLAQGTLIGIGLGTAAAGNAATAVAAFGTAFTIGGFRKASRERALSRANTILSRCKTNERRRRYRKLILNIRPDLKDYL